MPHNNHGPIPTPRHGLLSEASCPKCGAEMEPIDNAPDGPVLEHLQLCPDCYLVLWDDEQGIQMRQGVPMKKDTSPTNEPAWITGSAKKC
jgi:hypothetical protein